LPPLLVGGCFGVPARADYYGNTRRGVAGTRFLPVTAGFMTRSLILIAFSSFQLSVNKTSNSEASILSKLVLITQIPW
jgi:hypothetical protein